MIHPATSRDDAEPLRVTLDAASVKLLLDLIGDPDDPSEIELLFGHGHSGPGLYIALGEYPEEGSVLLVESKVAAHYGRAIDALRDIAALPAKPKTCGREIAIHALAMLGERRESV